MCWPHSAGEHNHQQCLKAACCDGTQPVPRVKMPTQHMARLTSRSQSFQSLQLHRVESELLVDGERLLSPRPSITYSQKPLERPMAQAWTIALKDMACVCVCHFGGNCPSRKEGMVRSKIFRRRQTRNHRSMPRLKGKSSIIPHAIHLKSISIICCLFTFCPKQDSPIAKP